MTLQKRTALNKLYIAVAKYQNLAELTTSREKITLAKYEITLFSK